MTKEERSVYMKRYRRENKADISKRKKAYYLANVEKTRAHFQSNKEHLKRKALEYYHKNKSCK